jgi:phage FluMu protein Com
MCRKAVGVTLRCEGAGLASDNPVASVKVPCPTCGGINQVFFSPDGTLLRVERERLRWRLPEPCPN